MTRVPSTRAAVASAALALAVALALTACTPGGGGTGTPTGSASASDDPSVSPSPSDSAAASDVLFTLSTVVPLGGGSTVSVTETVHAPTTASAAADAAAIAAAQCDGWDPASKAYLHVDVVSALVAGGSLAPENEIVLPLSSPDPVLVPMAWSGAAHLGQAYCAYGGTDLGTAHGIVGVVDGLAPDAAGGWGTWAWGIGVFAYGEGDDGDWLPASNCTIDVTPLGAASALVSAWSSTAPSYPGTCVFGPVP